MYALSLGCFLLTALILKESNSLPVEKGRDRYLPKKHNSIKTLNTFFFWWVNGSVICLK